MAGQDVFKALKDLPFRRFALVQLNRIEDLGQKLPPANFDQYPGKEEPAAFSCWYGPIPMEATRHVAASTGFDKLAALVTPETPVMPRDTNPLTGHDYAFHWKATNVFGYIKWGYKSDPALGFAVPIDAQPLGDLFDAPLEDNGGAQVWMNFSQSFDAFHVPKICFEIELYDKKRGRSITDGRIPAEAFLGGNFEFKPTFGGDPDNVDDGSMRWDADTEIEPRVYITEVKMGDVLNTDEAFAAAQVAVYLNIVFLGTFAYDAHPSGADYGEEDK